MSMDCDICGAKDSADEVKDKVDRNGIKVEMQFYHCIFCGSDYADHNQSKFNVEALKTALSPAQEDG